MTMNRQITRKFNSAGLRVSPGVESNVELDDLIRAYVRHFGGDWGEVDEQTRQLNDLAVQRGGSVLSVYSAQNGVKFLVRTDHDRLVTTFRLPGEQQ